MHSGLLTLVAVGGLMVVSLPARCSAEAADQGNEDRIQMLDAKAAAGSDEARLELAAYLLGTAEQPIDTRRLGHWLRVIVGEGEDDEHMLSAMLLLWKMKEKLRSEYPEVTEQMVLDSGGALGMAVIGQGGDRERVFEATIRDAWLLSFSTSILEMVYERHVEGFRRYDPRILEFYRVTSDEGVLRSMMFMGKILLNGWGVTPDVANGRRLLEDSEMEEAYMALAAHDLSRGDSDAAEEYLVKAAELDNADAIYELAIYAQEREEYGRSFKLMERVVELTPEDPIPRLEYARYFVHGWGTPKDEEKGFSIMKGVADNANGRAGAIASMNVAQFYYLGRGVEKSEELALVYVNKAKENGQEDAEEAFRRALLAPYR